MKTTKANLHLLSLLPIAALLAGACADPGDLDTSEEGLAPGASHAHMMAMPGMHRRKAAVGREEADGWGQSGYNFTYRGGPVISNVKVFTVFWNSTVPNQSSINSFYHDIVQSPHIDWLSEYNTPTQKIGRGSFIGSYVDTAAPTSTNLRDADIQKEIARLINSGKVPAPDADTLYMLHFPAGVSIDMDGNISCQQYCAYHGTFSNNGKNVYYGVMPDFSGGCASCGGTSNKLHNTTIISSHELVEAITDPAIGIANAKNDGSYLAWYDDQYGEIGDVCQSDAAMVGNWAVQGEYSMELGECIFTKPGTKPGTESRGTAGGGTGNGGGVTPACDHGVCLTGDPLLSTCGPCTAKVCAAEPSCCTDAWTASCKQKAVSLCGKKCQ